MPHGVLFRGAQEKVIREGIVRDDLIEAIIGLPPKLFYNVGIPACVIVINKNKPEHMKDRILFINADREYGEGRNQNYLRPEDIEKIVMVFDNKLEIPKYSRLVDLKEIEENDFNLNIRRYVDNSPDPEIEDVHAHLVCGVPKREVDLYERSFRRFNVPLNLLFEEKDGEYLEFKTNIREKNDIKEIIENMNAINETILKHKDRLKEWWNEVNPKIERFRGNNNLWDFRIKAIKGLKEALMPLGLLDEFRVSGIFVNWWEELKYDFKTIVSAGWSKNLIEDDRIKDKYFKAEVEEIEELESKIAEAEGELNELLEEFEDWDEEEQGSKTANKVKQYLEEEIKDILLVPKNQKWNKNFALALTKFNGEPLSDMTKKMIREMWQLHEKIDDRNKELSKWQRKLKSKTEELEGIYRKDKNTGQQVKVKEGKIDRKRNSLTESEAKGLLLEKFYDIVEEQLNQHLNAEKKEIIKILENLWDKYKVSLAILKEERDEETKKLDEFLEKLGYYNV
jgi:type I restriction enzyme M protein